MRSKKYKVNDKVIVITGSFKGKSGRVLCVKGNLVKVEGVWIRNSKVFNKEGQKYSQRETFLSISNIALMP